MRGEERRGEVVWWCEGSELVNLVCFVARPPLVHPPARCPVLSSFTCLVQLESQLPDISYLSSSDCLTGNHSALSTLRSQIRLSSVKASFFEICRHQKIIVLGPFPFEESQF